MQQLGHSCQFAVLEIFEARKFNELASFSASRIFYDDVHADH